MHAGGRPTVMTKLVVSKLEEAYANDATDEQACFLANISKQTLYDYQAKHPEFVDRKKALKAMVTYQAKINIKEAIFGDDTKEKIESSKWLLPKKEKAEYSERTELTGADGKDLVPDPETKGKIDNALDKVLNGRDKTNNK